MYINGDLSLVSSDLEPSKKEGDLRRLEMLLWRDCGASYYWGFLACNNQGKQLINRYYIDLLIGLKVWMHVPVRWLNLFLLIEDPCRKDWRHGPFAYNPVMWWTNSHMLFHSLQCNPFPLKWGGIGTSLDKVNRVVGEELCKLSKHTNNSQLS